MSLLTSVEGEDGSLLGGRVLHLCCHWISNDALRFIYKCKTSCHAPELILSTITMRLGTGGSEDSHVARHAREVELLLSIMLRVLVMGGTRTKSLALARTGLLSWFGGVLKGRPLKVLECNKGCAILFLRLLEESLRGSSGTVNNESIHVVPALPFSVCRLWNVVTTGSEVWSFVAEGLGSESLSTMLTRLLVLLKDGTPTGSPVAQEGALTSVLLNEVLCKITWRDEEHRLDMLVAITALPMNAGDLPDDLSLAKNLLQLTCLSRPPESSLVTILRRLAWLAKQQPDLAKHNEFIQALCSVRRLSCRYASTRQIWNSIYLQES